MAHAARMTLHRGSILARTSKELPMKQISIAPAAALATLLITASSLASTAAPTPTCTVIQRGALGDVYNAEIWSLAPSYHVPTPFEVNTGYSSTVGEKRALFG